MNRNFSSLDGTDENKNIEEHRISGEDTNFSEIDIKSWLDDIPEEYLTDQLKNLSKQPKVIAKEIVNESSKKDGQEEQNETTKEIEVPSIHTESNSLPEPFYLTSSLMKKITYHGEERQFCPYKLYKCEILKECETQITDAMLRGKYFETLCLGKCVDGNKVLELPQRKIRNNVKNTKTVLQIRIEEQAENFKKKLAEYFISLTFHNIHLPLYWRINNKYWLKGTPDIFPTTILYRNEMLPAIVELKYTGNIFNEFGEFCWGAPELMDHLQAYTYLFLANHLDLNDNEHLTKQINEQFWNVAKKIGIHFFYFVFGMQPPLNRQFKMIKASLDASHKAQLQQTIKKCISILEFYQQSGWEKRATAKDCNTCLIENCSERQITELR